MNVSRTPYVNGAYTNTGDEYVIQHIAVDNASFIVQYPFSHTRRLEFSTGYTHYGYSLESVTQGFDGRSNSRGATGAVVARPHAGLDRPRG